MQQAQQDLVQAGKLTGIGQMSAGISHELNQPLMAIRSYAENAEEFLRRGKDDIAGENLGRISDLARRMGRIIKTCVPLRGRRRSRWAASELGHVIDAVIELSQTRLREDKVDVTLDVPDAPVYVHGGEVRLQQVLVNLVSNALDAMEGREGKTLAISVTAGETVDVSVRDSGPGLSDPRRSSTRFTPQKKWAGPKGWGWACRFPTALCRALAVPFAAATILTVARW